MAVRSCRSVSEHPEDREGVSLAGRGRQRQRGEVEHVLGDLRLRRRLQRGDAVANHLDVLRREAADAVAGANGARREVGARPDPRLQRAVRDLDGDLLAVRVVAQIGPLRVEQREVARVDDGLAAVLAERRAAVQLHAQQEDVVVALGDVTGAVRSTRSNPRLSVVTKPELAEVGATDVALKVAGDETRHSCPTKALHATSCQYAMRSRGWISDIESSAAIVSPLAAPAKHQIADAPSSGIA